ncbi:hypothetical protein [Novosphingobium terrae]|uniref:hypothetical protein n=1 Tax=Novosphingobium terrae TaxID=2726189 RepID=UPI00197F7B90|nr:hypothetical protein [Novosphingobium terrae]
MTRWLYLLHIVGSMLAVVLAFNYVHVDATGAFDQASEKLWNSIQIFLKLQLIASIGLLFIMPRSNIILNLILAITSFFMVIGAYFAQMVAVLA